MYFKTGVTNSLTVMGGVKVRTIDIGISKKTGWIIHILAMEVCTMQPMKMEFANKKN